MEKINVSIVIVNYKVKKELFNCLNSIINSKPNIVYEIIVVDNDEKKTIEKDLLKKFGNVVKYIKNPVNSGYGGGNNLGAKNARGEFLFFLNPDTIVEKNAIDILYKTIKNDKKIGVVSPLLIDKNRKVYPLQGTLELTPLRAIFGITFLNKLFPNNPVAKKYWFKNWDKSKDKNVEVVPGTALMMKKKLFDKAGRFDENFFLYFEEFDLCKRIKSLGLKAKIIASAKVIHFWESSTKKRNDIKKIFAKSRLYYFKKNYGLLNALLVSMFTGINKETFFLFLILLLGTFLRFYKLDQLMIFNGDQGWFYLSAREMIVNNTVPLVGISSSVTWLKQGALATYFIAFSLFLGRFNPVFPAVLFSILDVVTIFLIYLIGKKWLNKNVGFFASLFYATSPLVLVMARMPYHTSPVPFFACLFFIVLVRRKKLLTFFLLFLILGLLIQLELSNSLLLALLLIYFLFNRVRISKIKVLFSVLGFFLGILPFIIYDLSHKFTQTIGLPLWIANRVRLFLGLTANGNSTTHNFFNALMTIRDQLSQIIFPFSITFFYLILFFLFVALFIKRRKMTKTNIFVIFLWLFIPLFGFLIHAAPGMAYFPLLFPAICLFLGFNFDFYAKFNKLLVIFIFLTIVFFNLSITVRSNYFIWTNKQDKMPPNNYGFGPTYLVFDDVAKKIVNDSKTRVFFVKGGAFLGKYKTGIDNFKYLIFKNGGVISTESSITYTIFAKEDVEGNSILKDKNKVPFYQNKYFYVFKEVEK